MRDRLPDTRASITHKLVIRHTKPNGKSERLHFYITVGLYKDGRPAELFITVNNGNETIAGFLRCWSIAISMLLQHGEKIPKLVEKFAYQAFEPAGFTESPDMQNCKSVIDYVIRWMEAEFDGEK